jgi:hypothetical protein
MIRYKIRFRLHFELRDVDPPKRPCGGSRQGSWSPMSRQAAYGNTLSVVDDRGDPLQYSMAYRRFSRDFSGPYTAPNVRRLSHQTPDKIESSGLSHPLLDTLLLALLVDAASLVPSAVCFRFDLDRRGQSLGLRQRLNLTPNPNLFDSLGSRESVKSSRSYALGCTAIVTRLDAALLVL